MKHRKGFTLIEITTVLAIITIIMGFGASINLSVFSRDNFQAEEVKIVAILEKARSRSISNMFDTTHGACLIPPNYIIFRERTTCLPTSETDEIIPANTNLTIDFPTVVFERLSGTLVPNLTPREAEIDISLSDGIKSANIKINNEGTINW